MLDIKQFLGINNVAADEGMRPNEQTEALNVDIDSEGKVQLRAGYGLIEATPTHSVFETSTMVLGVRGGDLVSYNQDGTVKATLVVGAGAHRVWYAQAPDGRVFFANGVNLQGSTNGEDFRPLGVPVPPHTGDVSTTQDAEAYEITVALAYRRLSDGLEGGFRHGRAAVSGQEISFIGLPVLEGFELVVYGAPSQHGALHRLGVTAGDTFAFRPGGTPDEILSWASTAEGAGTMTLRTEEFSSPPPQGGHMAFWHGRLLLAQGNTLWASKPFQSELFLLQRDFKQFEDEITMIAPAANGIWIGTRKQTIFLRGSKFDELSMAVAVEKGVVPGSAVGAPGAMVKGRPSLQLNFSDDVTLCVIDRQVYALTDAGEATSLTAEYYRTPAMTSAVASVNYMGSYAQYLVTPA